MFVPLYSIRPAPNFIKESWPAIPFEREPSKIELVAFFIVKVALELPLCMLLKEPAKPNVDKAPIVILFPLRLSWPLSDKRLPSVISLGVILLKAPALPAIIIPFAIFNGPEKELLILIPEGVSFNIPPPFNVSDWFPNNLTLMSISFPTGMAMVPEFGKFNSKF